MNISEWHALCVQNKPHISDANKEVIRKGFENISTSDLSLMAVDVLAILRERDYTAFCAALTATVELMAYDMGIPSTMDRFLPPTGLRSDGEWPK